MLQVAVQLSPLTVNGMMPGTHGQQEVIAAALVGVEERHPPSLKLASRYRWRSKRLKARLWRRSGTRMSEREIHLVIGQVRLEFYVFCFVSVLYVEESETVVAFGR